METTRLSSKGQIVLPKSLREACGWREGTEFVIERTRDGVLLRPVKPFAASRVSDVFASLPYAGKPKSVQEMDEGIRRAVRRRHRR